MRHFRLFAAHNVDQLLQLPFSADEESQLLTYLSTNHDPVSHELLVMYYLQRSRFIDAIRFNARLRHGSVASDASAQHVTSSSRALTRNSIVAGYERVLPWVQRKFAGFAPKLGEQRPSRTKRECEYGRLYACKCYLCMYSTVYIQVVCVVMVIVTFERYMFQLNDQRRCR